MKAKFLIPLGLFLVLAGFLFVGLKLDPKYVPSPLIDKPTPEFILPTLANPEQTFSPEQMKGKVWLFNVWATWCVACRSEHEVLNVMAKQGGVTIVSLNYKDERAKAMQWLKRLGNPYETTAMDVDGRVGINWGVYGTPESFVIDRKGIIRYKHVGPISVDDARDLIIPMMAKLEAEQ